MSGLRQVWKRLVSMSETTGDILGNYIDVVNGFAFKSKNFVSEAKEGLLPVIKIKNVANGDVHLNNAQYHELSENMSRYIVGYGDILLALTGNHPHAMTQVVGEASRYKLNEKALLNQRVAKIEPRDELNKDYLYYFLKDDATHDYLASQSSGSANQANISKQDIEALEFQLLPPPEQKAIAEVLSSLDDKIDLLHCQNKILEQMAETLFRQWFIEGAGEDWEERSLSSIASFLNGLACQKFPPKNDIDKLPVLKIKQLRNGFSDDSDWCTTDIKPEYVIENGDVIFSWSASLMVKIWDGSRCILNQHLFKVSSEEFPKWFYYLWSKHHLDEFISISSSHATTMGHIKRGDLDDAMVLVPSPDEMVELSELFTPLIDKIITNNKKLKNLEALRDTLLPKLMSGEVTVASNG